MIRPRNMARKAAKRWRKAHPGLMNAYARARELAKIRRTPTWADIPAIRAFYANCPQGMQVDHVIPLRGRLVSGLHVLNNLQYLPDKLNMSKGNRFDPWTFEHS